MPRYPKIGTHNGTPCIAFFDPDGTEKTGRLYVKSHEHARFILEGTKQDIERSIDRLTANGRDATFEKEAIRLIDEAIETYDTKGALKLGDAPCGGASAVGVFDQMRFRVRFCLWRFTRRVKTFFDNYMCP